ncbi:uncharacterized protein [Physcomitrium patens]|uniref:uncharacterized protein isoform X3 n=1 Tax=Physcomitrium patens TaxID=3218 RepID=UPI003CCD1E5D
MRGASIFRQLAVKAYKGSSLPLPETTSPICFEGSDCKVRNELQSLYVSAEQMESPPTMDMKKGLRNSISSILVVKVFPFRRSLYVLWCTQDY